MAAMAAMTSLVPSPSLAQVFDHLHSSHTAIDQRWSQKLAITTYNIFPLYQLMLLGSSAKMAGRISKGESQARVEILCHNQHVHVHVGC